MQSKDSNMRNTMQPMSDTEENLDIPGFFRLISWNCSRKKKHKNPQLISEIRSLSADRLPSSKRLQALGSPFKQLLHSIIFQLNKPTCHH
ncbi:hypothetical protein ACIQWQ_22720 [Peribacillus frigoritolerans]